MRLEARRLLGKEVSEPGKKTVAHTGFRTRNEVRGGTAVGKENPAASTEIEKEEGNAPSTPRPPPVLCKCWVWVEMFYCI